MKSSEMNGFLDEIPRKIIEIRSILGGDWEFMCSIKILYFMSSEIKTWVENNFSSTSLYYNEDIHNVELIAWSFMIKFHFDHRLSDINLYKFIYTS